MATPGASAPHTNVQLKTPKGTRDWVGQDLLLRDHIFKVFKQHGGIPLDTPVFELREILSEKYGEDARLIYDLADQGGERCSLRYDLTVPFARWLAMRTDVKQIKRYQIAKVYRRDQPAVARGRLREFYQCDFDIAGVYDPMIPDAEILRVITEVFGALRLGIAIKLNHRRILDGLFAAAGVPPALIRPTSAAVDKLDKAPWADVRREMVEEKGLAADVADRVGAYVHHSGGLDDVVQLLRADETLVANESIQAGLADMGLLAAYLAAMGALDKVSFDLSLARGLDYYSGLIFEVVPRPQPGAAAASSTQVGSIAAGGRYDGLVGMYGKQPVPCVGLSFGVDRIFTLLAAQRHNKGLAAELARDMDVYVMALGGKDSTGLLEARMAVACRVWEAGLRAEFTAKVKPRSGQQFSAARDVPVTIIIGEEEAAAGQVSVKATSPGTENTEKDRGRLVSLDDMVVEVKRLLAASSSETKLGRQ